MGDQGIFDLLDKLDMGSGSILQGNQQYIVTSLEYQPYLHIGDILHFSPQFARTAALCLNCLVIIVYHDGRMEPGILKAIEKTYQNMLKIPPQLVDSPISCCFPISNIETH